MNTYERYANNVFLAKCKTQHQKGDTAILTTKHGKENQVIIYNLILEKNGFFYYSFVRADGLNSQEYAKREVEKLNNLAHKAIKKSDQYYQASQENKEFLSLGEPIKIGHHSEKKHRALFKRNWQRMEKSVEFDQKAQTLKERAEYWAEKSDKIDLSMPESLDYFAFELEKAKERHKFLKDNPEEREHSFSLSYANKKLKDIQKKLNLAQKLWG